MVVMALLLASVTVTLRAHVQGSPSVRDASLAMHAEQRFATPQDIARALVG